MYHIYLFHFDGPTVQIANAHRHTHTHNPLNFDIQIIQIGYHMRYAYYGIHLL